MPEDTARQRVLGAALDHVVARARRRPSEVPAAIAKLVRFKKIPVSAQAQIERTVELDAAFRQAMTKGATEKSVGAAGVLWLRRPPGWEDALDRLIADEERRMSAIERALREDEEDRSAEMMQRELIELKGELDAVRAEISSLREERAADRALRHELRQQLDAEAARADQLEAARAEAVRQLKTTERLLARSVARAKRLQAEVDVAAGVTTAPGPEAETAVEAAREFDTEPEPDASSVAVRVPIQLPGGIWDDSTAAMDHLMRVESAVVLVDGYNASMSRWSSLDIEQQRIHLVAAMNNVAARSGLSVIVVWDGADGHSPVPGRRDRGVAVRFTSADQEADDWIIEYCRQEEVHVSLIVASDDERVRSGVRRAGANVITTKQLLDYAIS